MSDHDPLSIWLPPEPPTVPESRVDRALRLQAEYVAARAALRGETSEFTDAEWREYIERQGR